jgi:NAD(P)-dependent dehydrogenase (short-subunit alcohol dehydrogenase family)
MTKTVLITGCSSGIGRQLAIRLQEKGYRVYASGRSLEKISSLQSLGIKPLVLDVTCADSIRQAMETIQANGDQIDWLINNAGYGAMGPLAEMPHAEVEKQFATNLFGPLALVRALVPQMKQRGGGKIINIGSVSGILVTPFSGIYCATKAALHAASDALRMELAPFGIEVVVIQPGAIESEFGNNAEASLARTFDESSLYAGVKDGILKRARASQHKPTPTVEFVEQLLAVAEKSSSPAVTRIGHGSFALPLVARWLPVALRDSILKKSFGLNRLKS